MKKMYGSILFTFVLIISFSLTNCSNSSTEPQEDENINPNNWEMVGTWIGANFKFVSQADTSIQVDLSLYGVAYSIVINADSSYSSSTSFLGQATIETGKLVINENEIILESIENGSRSGTYTLENEIFKILITNEEFDFNQDGTDDPAFLFLDLIKT